MLFITQNWFFVALIAPCLWAVVAIIDTYFVNSLYEDAYDGTVISGVFQSFLWFLVPIGVIQFAFPGMALAAEALLAGGFFMLAFFCYFKALFVSNDSTLMEIILNLSILAVPFLAWLLIGEVLSHAHYAGIGVAFIGILLFNFDAEIRQIGLSKIFVPMIGAVVFISLAMVIAREAYQFSNDFWSIFLLFSFGATLMALAILAIGVKDPFRRAKKIAVLSRKYFFIFALAEGLSIAATIASQFAISLAPAVSFVAVIESLLPVFVMTLSLFIVFFFRDTKKIDVTPYRNQVTSMEIKILSLAFIAAGLYMIS